MNIEYKNEIKSPDQLLLLEINERVYYSLLTLKDGMKVNQLDIDILEIDKDSLKEYKGHSEVMANNLLKKIDFILKEN